MDSNGELVNSAPSAPIRHEKLWFPGGDVVLKTDTHLFKVHKDVLSLQSSVFKDMFAFEGEQAVEDGAGMVHELYEGLPLVGLVGDEGKDVAHLLQAAYYRDYYDREDDGTPLETIVALLSLSTKYDFKLIRKDIVKQISRNYPNSLTAFDRIDEQSCHPDFNLFGVHRGDCDFRLLEICYTANADILLPILYYACAEYDSEWIFKLGYRLNKDCLHNLIKGKFELEHAVSKLLVSLPEELRSISCASCKPGPYISHLQNIGIESFLSRYEGSSLLYELSTNCCKQCSKELESQIDAKRKETWQKIPEFFGFPGWEELRERSEES